MSRGAVARSGHEIDVHHHFVWGTEKEAMETLLSEYQDRNPDVSFAEEQTAINSLRLMVKSRILKEDPPDVWDEWPGANLRPTVEAGATADITDIWEDTGMERAYFDGMAEAARFDGEYHAIPLDLARISNLYYDVHAFEAAGVDPSRLDGPGELVEVLPALAEHRTNPYAVFGRNPFGLLQLWETLFLAHGDPGSYEAAVEGDAARQRGLVREAFATLGALIDAGPDNIEFMDSSDMDTGFSDGETACINNGSWTTGHMGSQPDLEYGRDWDCITFPGTGDAHLVNTNAFIASADAGDDETVREFIRYLGTAETNERFNTVSGSIPPRGDVDVEGIHPLSRELHQEFSRGATMLPSMCHGLAVPPERIAELKDAVVTFLSTRDVEDSTDSVVATLSE
jgi:glucose/mannose transport system substrate-binding protein